MLTESFSQKQVKEQIPHTWPLFFARHGRFTPIQQQAIPTILKGQDTLVIAATAAGKTEAVIAPLLERNWDALKQPGLQLLYICPTRALVRDLYARLRPMLEDTGIIMGMKTADVPRTVHPPTILLTTPESTDSLLTRSPRLFAGLQAVVLDEVHLFDHTPRGDHLRCLLSRLAYIRQYAQPEAPPIQRVALSATVTDPAGVVGRYLHQGVVVAVPGSRHIAVEIRPLYDLSVLTEALKQRPAYKSLIFCNSRQEVEETAVTLRQQLPHHADIFVHYSNLDIAVRRDVEERFAAAATAVCVATSTLELGVDIGSVDDVVLLGAPPTVNAFLQRIGRGNRRTAQSRALCLPHSPGEWARFEALLWLAQEMGTQPSGHPATPQTPISDQVYAFRPSVLVQQIFSLLKQSPTGAVRLADVRRIAPPEISSEEIRKIVSQLLFAGYLQMGRPGEWKPDVRLQELLDEAEIFSNLGGELHSITAVDAFTGRPLAQTEQSYPPGAILLLNARPMRVVWVEKYRFGLVEAPGAVADDVLRVSQTRAAVPFAVTQRVAQSLGLKAGELVVVPQAFGATLFHFWGTVWGELLTAVLVAQGILAESINEYGLHLYQPMSQLPPWEDKTAQIAARKTAVTITGYVDMGRFHRLLPADVALSATLSQLNLPQFRQLMHQSQIAPYPHLHAQLEMLL